MKKYSIVYKDNFNGQLNFYENLGPYQLWLNLFNVEHRFDYYPSVPEDLFFVEYDGYVWDCTNHDILRQVKRRLMKELQV